MSQINETESSALNPAVQTYLGIGLGFLSFAVPFFLSGSQLITGTIVNAALFISAYTLPRKYFLPIIVLPSIATLSRGLVFGPFTPFLAYFLPIIWLGNFTLISVFKQFLGKNHALIGIVVSSVAKFLLLYGIAQVYFSLHLVPKLFLTVMGMLQLITALAGGALAFFIMKTTVLKNMADK